MANITVVENGQSVHNLIIWPTTGDGLWILHITPTSHNYQELVTKSHSYAMGYTVGYVRC